MVESCYYWGDVAKNTEIDVVTVIEDDREYYCYNKIYKNRSGVDSAINL
jgi:hypothetical protein